MVKMSMTRPVFPRRYWPGKAPENAGDEDEDDDDGLAQVIANRARKGRDAAPAEVLDSGGGADSGSR